jgi:hypothetical protein
MSEETFFNQVKGQLVNYSPEVPEAVYAGMRRKYARSRFFAWNASRLNIWYVALLLTGAASILCLTNSETEVAAQKAIQTNETIMNAPVAASCAATSHEVTVQPRVAVAASHRNNASAKSSKDFSFTEIALPNVETTLPNGSQEIAGTESSEVKSNTTPIETIEEIVKEQEKKERKKLTVPVLKSTDK